MRYRSALVPVLLALLPLQAAYGDIGGIGSPVVPSNLPHKAKNADQAPEDQTEQAAPAAEEREPVLVIRFNQKHVYFDRSLRQAVTATERAKAGAFYDVVSYVPAGGDREQNSRINDEAGGNLAAVIQEMGTDGVDSSRIRASTQSSTTVNVQEVRIYVN